MSRYSNFKNKSIETLILCCQFTQGGVCKFEEEHDNHLKPEAEEATAGREGFYGWMGFGGSVFQWNPELNIGLGSDKQR